MTIDEVIQNANQNDVQAMWTLINHYVEPGNTDFEQAEYWAERLANLGYVDGMVRAAAIYNLHAHIKLKIGDSYLWQEALEKAQKAIYWADLAIKNGSNDGMKHIIRANRTIGVSYLTVAIECSKNNDSINTINYLNTSIGYLKGVYNDLLKENDDEILYHLGKALFLMSLHLDENHQVLLQDDCNLMIYCLETFVQTHAFDHWGTGQVYSFLGSIFTFGFGGVPIDTNRGYFYYYTAHNNCNYDSSEMLSRFRKNQYGDYYYE